MHQRTPQWRDEEADSRRHSHDHRVSAEPGVVRAKRRAPKGRWERDRWPVRESEKLCRWNATQATLPRPSEMVAHVWRIPPSTREEYAPRACALRTEIH